MTHSPGVFFFDGILRETFLLDKMGLPLHLPYHFIFPQVMEGHSCLIFCAYKMACDQTAKLLVNKLGMLPEKGAAATAAAEGLQVRGAGGFGDRAWG